MTADERKRGLRAAVDAKMRHEAGQTVSVGHYAAVKEDLLWSIIDSLVEERAEYSAVVAEFMQDVQANGVKITGVEWPDLLITYNKARRVRPADKKGCLCKDADAHLCLVKRGGCNLDELQRQCFCGCHVRQADESCRICQGQGCIQETGRTCPECRGAGVRPAQRELILAYEREHGQAWLGNINLYEEDRGKPVIWRWDGEIVLNFGARFVIPHFDLELERLILERDRAEYTGTAADYERIKLIHARIHELGGEILLWN